MSFKCDFKFKMRPQAVKEIEEKLAIKWKRVTQECVGEAKKRSPHKTGHNMRSINPAGAVHSSGATNINPRNIEGEVFTTSGYGGYLEVGTHKGDGTPKMEARPYIVPAVEYVKKNVAPGILKNTL